jgi:hypothetical protein
MTGFDVVLQIVMLLLAGYAGYGIRAIHKPIPKRGKNGRFIKK